MDHQNTLHLYTTLHHYFPEDVCLARLLAQQMLQENPKEAQRFCLKMARRLSAHHQQSQAMLFLRLCQTFGYHYQTDIDRLQKKIQLGQHSSSPYTGLQFPFITSLLDKEAEHFLSAGELLNIPKDTLIVQQNAIEDSFHILLHGKMEAYLDQVDGSQLQVGLIQTGDFFGEFAAIYHIPRTANVRTLEDSISLRFTEQDIHQLLVRLPEAGETIISTIRKRLIDATVRKHPAFKSIDKEEQEWLTKASLIKEYNAGDCIYQAQQEQQCYLLTHGTASLTAAHKISKTMQEGSLFGDSEFLSTSVQSRQIIAKEHCLVSVFPTRIFNNFMQAHQVFHDWVQHYPLGENKDKA